MYLRAVLLLFVGVVAAQAYKEEGVIDLLEEGTSVEANQCPMSATKTKPTAEPTLQYCKQFVNSACCTPAEDLAVETEMNTYWRSLTGHCPGCLANAKRFACAYTCSPDMRGFITPTPNEPQGKKQSGVIKMCPQFCNNYFASCVNTSIADKFASNANAFCVSMIDTSKGSSIRLNKYDCFNDADAANTCEGDTIPPKAKSRMNLWFIMTCIILSITAVILILAIFVSDSPTGAAAMTADWKAVNRQDAEEETPLFTPADQETDVEVR